MATRISRPGSGRTKGSFSFVLITLDELNQRFADKTTQIKVSRKQLEACGFTNLSAAPASELTAKIEGTTKGTEVQENEISLV